MPLMLAYDIGSARLKYVEGFWVNPSTGEIQSRPAQAWSSSDQVHVEPLYYILASALALENSVFFLLQSFWSYISKSVTKSSFMSSFEFKVNIVFSLFVMIVYPTIQYLFRNDIAYREAVPQLVFSIMTFITGVLGIRTHFRLSVLIKAARGVTNESTASVLRKLEYFKDMNLVLTFGFFGCSIPLGIASVDGLTTNPIIATNKFASDFLITNLNFFELIVWVTLILIFYPRKTGAGSPFMGSSTGDSAFNRSSKDAYLPRFSDVRHQDSHSNDSADHMDSKEMSYGGRQSRRHERTFSNESRQATLVPIEPPATAATSRTTSLNPPPKAASNSRSSSNPTKPELNTPTIYYRDVLANNANSNSSSTKPELTTTTIYYHDGLVNNTNTNSNPTKPELNTPTIYYRDGFTNNANSNSSSTKPELTTTTIYYHDGLANNANSNSSSTKPELITTTLYYHEALAKAQQLQKEQANEQYTKGLQSGTAHKSNSLPQQQKQQQKQYHERHFSNNSQYSVQSQEPRRSASSASQLPLIPKPSKNPSRNTPSALEHRSGDYPSLAQEATVWSQNQPDNIQRSFSSGSLRQHQMQRQQMDNDMISGMRAASAMGQRSASEESDREMIQIAYIRDMSQRANPTNTNSFYEGVQDHVSPSIPSASRPYSPRHF
ncbi:hypothetical protein BGX20_009171 [Mortierella sp. AD010]|nr:hypothetical protein BGX20_009171 [Mortierella sp. AD010]